MDSKNFREIKGINQIKFKNSIKNSKFSTEIPFSEYESYMHKRKVLLKESYSERNARLKQVYEWFPRMKLEEYIVCKLIKVFHIRNVRFRWSIYHIIMKMMYIKYRLINRLEIRGFNNIPSQGGIFYLNHLGSADVPILLSSVGKPISAFFAVDAGLMADVFETYFYHVIRRGTSENMIEQMIRTILLRNRYFAIWPEGNIPEDRQVMESFSSFVKVYATINAQKDKIPLVPIFYQGSDCYYFGQKRSMKKIILQIFKPFYLPRTWLLPPDQGGKTPREISNYLMMKLAKVNRQTELKPNPLLERRRKKHQIW